MKKTLSILVSCIMILGMFCAPVFAEDLLVINEQFTSPWPYAPGEQTTLPVLPSSLTAGQFYNTYNYEDRPIYRTALEPGMAGYPAGGEGSIVKIVRAGLSAGGSGADVGARYALPEITSGTVTVEMRIYKTARVYANNLQQKINVGGAVINFHDQGEAVRVAGTTVANNKKYGNYNTVGGWHTVKFILFKSSSSGNYDRVKLYYDDIANTNSSVLDGDELTLSTAVAAITRIDFVLGTGQQTALEPMYIDYIKVSVDGATESGTLAKPAAPEWNGNTLSWTDSQPNVAAYRVALYKDASLYGTYTFAPATKSYDFSAVLDTAPAAQWKAAVTAKGARLAMNALYADSPESDQSDPRAYVAPQIEVVSEQFTSPHPYAAGVQTTLDFSGSPAVGQFYNTYEWGGRDVNLTALEPGMSAYQAGGDGNIVELIKPEASGAVDVTAIYTLPVITSGTVTVEARVYMGTRVAADDLQQRIQVGKSGGYAGFNFHDGGTGVRILGTSDAPTGTVVQTPAAGAWRDLKFVFSKSAGSPNYNKVQLYYNNTLLTGGELTLATPVDSIDRINFYFGKADQAQRPIYIDYIKLTASGEYQDTLDTPAAPEWNGNTLSWTAVQPANVAAYDVTFYKNGEKDKTFTFAPSQTTTSGFAGFAAYIAADEGAHWTATVTARGTRLAMNALYADSEESDQSRPHGSRQYGNFIICKPVVDNSDPETATVTAKVERISESGFEPYVLIIAAYDGNALTAISSCALTNTDEPQELSTSVTLTGAAARYQVFRWKSLTTLEPVDGVLPVN